jgi:hypothetical protein
MEEKLYPEEQMQIEKAALDAFLFAADFGRVGIAHLINELQSLKERLVEYDEV